MGNKIAGEDVYLYLELKDKIEQRVHEVLYNKTTLETGKPYLGDIDKIEFENQNVEVTTIEYGCSGCSDDSRYYSFPINYLFDDDYLESVKDEVKRRKEKAARKQAEIEERRKKETEERDRKEYERLQKKFGGVANEAD